ncbi:MAG: hypothetical protein J6N54_09230, partial [Bacteroidales bacterium]|nr:hypothetical protein [Bacteroidales bacterium]
PLRDRKRVGPSARLVSGAEPPLRDRKRVGPSARLVSGAEPPLRDWKGSALRLRSGTGGRDRRIYWC